VADDSAGVNWPSFRGERAAGVAEGYSTLTTWSVGRDEGIRWRTPIPGLAHSSPVIWGDRIFLTTAVGAEGDDPYLKVGLYGDIKAVEGEPAQRFEVWCLHKKSGEVLWKRTAHEGVPKVKRHTKSTHANPTPATDGERLVVSFGSEGLYAYDLDGELLWKKDLGVLDAGFFMVPTAQWGYGSSPILHDGRVIVLADVLGDSFLAAFDARNGQELWRTSRDDVPTWGTPTIVEVGDRTQVVVNGFRQIAAYDFGTGKQIWRLLGGGDIPVPTPVVGHDLIFITNGHGGSQPIYAIRTTATGGISLAEGTTSNEHVLWSRDKDGAYIPTPLVYGDHLYVLRDNGILRCFDARRGLKLYSKRVGDGSSGFSASMVAADDKLYIADESGDVHVVRAGMNFEVLATNSMNEIVMATPAISEGVIYFRTRGHLVAVGGADPPPTPVEEVTDPSQEN
jgi:outer membrane protein assembly factor BamB